jgi:hypothetical protein
MVDARLRIGVNAGAQLATVERSELSTNLFHVSGLERRLARSAGETETHWTSLMKRSYLVVFAVIATALIAACILLLSTAFPSETIRYRLTLEVEIDGKPVAGSGVIQVKQFDTAAVLRSTGGAGAEVNGEAIILDLGRRGLVFGLLRGATLGLSEEWGPRSLLLRVFGDVFGSETGPLPRIRILQRERPRRELPPTYLPMLVHFRDVNDPKSIEQLDPTNFGATLGPGIVLRRAMIEITDDPITTGIEARLPWLSGLRKGGALDGSRFSANNSLESNLGYLSFKREGM